MSACQNSRKNSRKVISWRESMPSFTRFLVISSVVLLTASTRGTGLAESESEKMQTAERFTSFIQTTDCGSDWCKPEPPEPPDEQDSPSQRRGASQQRGSSSQGSSLWQCFPDYQTCKEACMQSTGDWDSGWCPGICAENGTGSRPKPAQFGRQRCFQPR